MGSGNYSLPGTKLYYDDDDVNYPRYSIELGPSNDTGAGLRAPDHSVQVESIAIGKNTSGGGFDPILYIFQEGTINSPSYYQYVTKNDDGLGNNNSKVSFTAAANEYYYSVIKSYYSLANGQSLPYYVETHYDDAGNALADARNLGSLNTAITVEDFVGIVDPNDYYTFSLSNTSNVSLSLNSAYYPVLEADLDIQLLNDVGTVVASSTLTDSDSESINTTLASGTYYVRVYPFNTSIDTVLSGTRVAANYRLGLSAASVPSINFSQETPYQVAEGAGTSNSITLLRSGDTATAAQVQLSITGGTAAAGADYTSSGFPLTVNFAAGETSKTVEIPIVQDTAIEGTETITFSLTGLSNAAIGPTNTTTLQILDDDRKTGGTGNTGDNSDRLIGTATANTLVGNARDNFLSGKGGKDTLTGGDGRDEFVFDINARFNKRVMGVDVITDFVHGTDTIVLDRTTFTKLKGETLKRTDFASVKSVKPAQKSKALFTYIRSSGALFYNENRAKAGFGAGGQFADLTDGLALSRTDIAVVK